MEIERAPQEEPEDVPQEEPVSQEDAASEGSDAVAETPAVEAEPAVAYDAVIAPSPSELARADMQREAASAAVMDAPDDVDWNTMLQSCTRVLQNYKGFADLHAIVEHATRLDGYRRELIRVIQLNEAALAQSQTALQTFEADMAHQRQMLHEQLLNEQSRTKDELETLTAQRELAQAEADREEKDSEARIAKAQANAEAEEARIEASMADMKKAEKNFKARMAAMRGKIEEFTGA